MPTRTFLFVDQVRSTRRPAAALGDPAAHEIRRALFDLLRQATEVSRWRRTPLVVAFDGAAEAADAAILMQQLCASFNERQTADSRLALRIGLNAGEPLTSEGGGYFGVAVVVASRLSGTTAQEGQILVSDLIRSLVEPRGVNRFDPIGEVSLRGVPEPVTTYELHWESDTRPAQLPARLADLRSGPFVDENIPKTRNRVRLGGGESRRSPIRADQRGPRPRRFPTARGDGRGAPRRRRGGVVRGEPTIGWDGADPGVRPYSAGRSPPPGPSCGWPWVRRPATCCVWLPVLPISCRGYHRRSR